MATAYAKKDQKAGKGDNLTTLVQYVDDAEDATRNGRADSLRYRRYYDGNQLTDAELAVLRKRGQPPIVINRIQRKVDYLIGTEMQQRSDPRAFPRTPKEEQGAEAATDALRFVAEKNRFDVVRSRVWENMIVEGFGGAETLVEMKTDRRGQEQAEIVVKHWNWDRLGYDPHSREPDFSDAKYLYTVTWMDHEDAVAQWPDAEEAITASYTGEQADDATEDRPRDMMWADPKRKRIKVIGMYYRDGKMRWHQCIFTKGGKLEAKPVPFVDEHGESVCPLVLASAYVDLDNDRYGVVRAMQGPQDELNKRRSKALHLLTMRQTAAPTGAIEDVRKMKQELAKPDGHVEYTQVNDGKFEILTTGDQVAANFQLMEHAMAELDLMGPNAAMAGKDQRDQSGRAILAQQAGGQVELMPLMDQLRQWSMRMYRLIWNLVRQYWTEERWIRVTDNEENVRFVGLNRPVPMQEALEREAQRIGMPPEQFQGRLQQIVAQRGPQFLQEPSGEVENAVAELDVDIIVDETMDTPNIQIEQFMQMAELAKGGVPIPPDVLILASQLRNKQELVERMKGNTDDPQAQQQMQMQQQAMQAQLAELQAKIEKMQADTGLARAKTMETLSNIGKPDSEPQPVDPLERAKLAADVENTRVQTAKTASEIGQREPEQPFAMEKAQADVMKTLADAYATKKMADRPAPTKAA